MPGPVLESMSRAPSGLARATEKNSFNRLHWAFAKLTPKRSAETSSLKRLYPMASRISTLVGRLDAQMWEPRYDIGLATISSRQTDICLSYDSWGKYQARTSNALKANGCIRQVGLVIPLLIDIPTKRDGS